MRFDDYIKDKRFFIIFYFVLMAFVSLVIYLDPRNRIAIRNIIYINAVGFVFFLVYLVAGYLYHRRYYAKIKNVLDFQEGDLIYHLPEPATGEQKIFNNLLKRLYNELNSTIERLKVEKQENREFVASWFHEIKTPISVCRLILEDNEEMDRQEILLSLDEELDKIEAQVEQALYYARVDSFEKDYLIGEYKLEEVVKEVAKKHARSFISRKIELEMKNIDLVVHTDKKWLSFIIDQIVSNALKYTAKGGKISIRGEVEKNKKILLIRDNGIGIKPEDIGRVFEKGFTGNTGRKESKSTGIGLYLVKKLAGRLGHDINIESEYGEFAEVSIVFPRLRDHYDLEK